MAVADEVRAKGRALYSLARRVSEHLGGREDEEWVESELHGMMKELRVSLAELEDDLDVPWAGQEQSPVSAPAVGTAAATTGQPASPPATEGAAPDTGGEERAPGGEPLVPGPSVLRSLERDLSEGAERLRPKSPIGDLRRRALAGGFSRPDFDHPGESPAASFGFFGGNEEEAQEVGDDQVTTLEDFFGRVGESLISAQRQLDQRSRQVIAETTDDPAARQLATLYRIPKVSAELKFALQTQGEKGLNVIFFKQGTQSSALNQQSVQFEIAAIPAPPETLDGVAAKSPRLVWVLDGSSRRQVFAVLAEAEPVEGSTAAQRKALSADRDRLVARGNRLLIVREPDQEDAFFLADATTAPATTTPATTTSDQPAGVWRLETVEGKARLARVIRLEGSPSEAGDPSPARRLVARLGERQAEFLGQP